MRFENATIVYGDAAPAAKYQFLRGGEADTVLTADNFATELPGAKIVLLNSENQIVTDTTKLDAGIYTYTVLYTPEGCNIKLTVEGGKLTVAPRSVYLQVKDASMTEGESFPAVEFSFFEADKDGNKLDAVEGWMSDELAKTKIAVAYADATQGPKLSAGQYDMSFDQIAFADAASAANAKVAMSVTGLYNNENYDVNLFTLNEEHTKLATLTVNKKPSSGGHHSSSSSNKGSDNNNAAEEQSAVQQITAVQPASVQTGDNSSLLLNLAILLASVLGLVVILRKKI